MRVAVIGGGPAGLVTLKFLAEAHKYFQVPQVEVRLLEAEDHIGGTFVYRVYEDAEMVSSKYLTAFSDFRLPLDAPDFITPKAYVQYLNDYIDHFKLRGFINLQSRVTRMTRNADGLHAIEVTKGDGSLSTWTCHAVAVCSGVHVWPQIPELRGIENVPTVLHSSQVKTRSQFGKDTNVVVLGCGETGMDMLHLAVTSPTKSVTLCLRDGFFCAPKIIPQPIIWGRKLPGLVSKPVDTSVASLFDTAYAHPMLQRSPLLWFAYNQWVKKVHWLISGTEEGPDQWVGQISKKRKNLSSIFLCKSDRALPYLSVGHRSNSLVHRIRSKLINVPIRETNGRTIETKAWPTGIDENGFVSFGGDSAEKQLKADVVVFATGYTTKFPFLDQTYPTLNQVNIRGIYKEDDVSVGFIGFVRPSLGAIPPLAEMQAQLWILRLLQHEYPDIVGNERQKNAVESYEMDYKLHPRCGYDFASTKRGVDHESYAYQLALDMGSAPTIGHVMTKGWKIFFTWAMGSNFNTKFRMVGPWKWEVGAERIMGGELYDVVKLTGGAFYLTTYTLIPLVIFGVISMVLHTVSGLTNLIVKLADSMSKPFLKLGKK